MARKHVQPSKVLVSVIIPNFRRFDMLEKCLKALPDAFGDIPYEVIVVDNGSPLEEKKPFFSSIPPMDTFTVIELKQNVGFPAACNRGVKQSRGPLTFFLNNDVIMETGSGEKLVRAMDDPKVGICGMKLLFPSEQMLIEAGVNYGNGQRPPQTIQHVGLFTNIRGQVIHMYLGWSGDNPRVNAIKDVYAVTGAALMTRRGLFLSCSGFDPVYGMGTYEDVDYSMKVREKKHRIIVETGAVGTHFAGATAEKFQLAFPLNENRMIFEQKWYNKLEWTEYLAW